VWAGDNVGVLSGDCRVVGCCPPRQFDDSVRDGKLDAVGGGGGGDVGDVVSVLSAFISASSRVDVGRNERKLLTMAADQSTSATSATPPPFPFPPFPSSSFFLFFFFYITSISSDSIFFRSLFDFRLLFLLARIDFWKRRGESFKNLKESPAFCRPAHPPFPNRI